MVFVSVLMLLGVDIFLCGICGCVVFGSVLLFVGVDVVMWHFVLL